MPRKPVHESEHAPKRIKAQGPPSTNAGDEAWLVDRKRSEPRRAHRVKREKAVDFIDHVGLGGSNHAHLHISTSRKAQAETSRGQKDIDAAIPAAMEPAPLYKMLEAIKPENMAWSAWADKAGLNPNFFSDIKKGTDPGLFKITRVCAAIGRTLPELLGIKSEPRPVVPSAAVLLSLLEVLVPKPMDRPSREANLYALAIAMHGALRGLATNQAAFSDPIAAQGAALALIAQSQTQAS